MTELDAATRERAGRAAADAGRRRVRARLLGLGVDRHRADARGGRRDLARIAQDEIGHAKAWYELLAELTDDDPDRIAFGRDPDAYRHAALMNHPRTDWAFTVARRFLYETADAVRLEVAGRLDLRAAWPSWRARCGARRPTTSCTSMPGCSAWPEAGRRARDAWPTRSAACGRMRCPSSRRSTARTTLVRAGILPEPLDVAASAVARAGRRRAGEPGPVPAPPRPRPAPGGRPDAPDR